MRCLPTGGAYVCSFIDVAHESLNAQRRHKRRDVSSVLGRAFCSRFVMALLRVFIAAIHFVGQLFNIELNVVS